MIIRHFQKSDFPPVAELLNRTYNKSSSLSGLTPDRLQHELVELGGDLKKNYLVLESQKGELVGFCGYSAPSGNGRARMDGPVIAYGERGQGLGERLWHELVDLMRSRKMSSVTAMLSDENRIASRFLTRLGFQRGSTQLIVTSDKPYEGKVSTPKGLTIHCIGPGDSLDKASYTALHSKLFEARGESFLDFLVSQPDYIFFVGERNGEMVGFLELELVDDTAIIESFGVHPSHRRNGFGSALLRSALDFAWRQSGVRLVRQIWKTEQPEFLKIYTRLGFRQKAAMFHMEKAIK